MPIVDPAFAVDGIGELLEGFFGRPDRGLRADPPTTLRIVSTDADTSWLVVLGPDRREITRDAGGTDADCALHARAADLYLHLWNRTPAAPVEVSGDPAVLELWRTRARVRWS